ICWEGWASGDRFLDAGAVGEVLQPVVPVDSNRVAAFPSASETETRGCAVAEHRRAQEHPSACGAAPRAAVATASSLSVGCCPTLLSSFCRQPPSRQNCYSA